jgi:carboxyl-terminal processing protease
MRKRNNFWPAGVIIAVLSWQIQSLSQTSSTVEQIWRLINDQYFDTTFNGANWPQVREQFRAKKYDSPLAVNQARRSILQQLNDPAVRILTPEQVAPFRQELSGKSYTGIGLAELLSIDTDSKSRQITIVTPIPGTPSAIAGMQPGDVVTAVNNISTAGKSLSDTMMQMRSKPQTKVKLTILRSSKTIQVTLNPSIIPAPVIQSWIKPLGTKKIGCIAFSQFTANAATEMRSAVQDLLKQGANAFVLDIRNNPGGDVAAGKKVAGIFLGAKPMAKVLGRGGNITPLIAEGEKLTDKPLNVLVNSGTASMAEVLASALQENQRAKIIGVQTFGKSLIQTLENLSDQSALLIPIGKIRTLSGREIFNNGITPNVNVNLTLSPILNPKKIAPTSSQDTQFQKAVSTVLAGK